MSDTVAKKAEALALAAGMQFDSRYMHWVSPRGQFECEPWYAPYYWNLTMEGDGEELCYPTDPEESDDSSVATLFQVDSEESETFGLEWGHWILMRQDSQGFVLCTVHATRDAAEARYLTWLA